MNCCTPETLCNAPETTAQGTSQPETCVNCGIQSKPVSRKTVLLMLKPQLLEEALTGKYRFCATRDCPIVYLEEDGNRVFTRNDLRVVVGAKSITDPIPLCYCFGFNESHLREEISETGNTTIPERISNLIREGLCACESRNPSGGCCLGEVNRTANKFKLRFPL
jgi:Zinc binding domain